MLAAIAAASIAVVASLAVGQALLSLGGRRGWDPLAGPVGLAGLVVVCALAAKLPGRGGAAVVVAGAVVLVAVSWLVAVGLVGKRVRAGAVGELRDGGSSRPRLGSGAFGAYMTRKAPGAAVCAVVAAVAAALAAAIPFAVNDRVGVLGVALVNDDMANHLLIADWVQHGTEPMPSIIGDGYPLGPHSVAATLAELLGTGLVEAFAGLTLAIAAIGALTAFAALGNLPLGRRTLAAPLAALPYLGAAYLIQGAFKEPLQAILLIAFALLLVRAGPRAETGAHTGDKAAPGRSAGVRVAVAAVPPAVVIAGSVYNYSFPGLLWLAGTAAIWWLAASGSPSLHALGASARRAAPGTAARRAAPGTAATLSLAARRAAPSIAAVAALAALLTLPDWGRIADFTGFGAFAPSGEQTGLGNLRQSISPLEALGIWPSGEFRLTPADATIPAAAFYLGGLLAATALAVGVARAVARRRAEPVGIALLAALGAAVVVYAGAEIGGTPYTAAKALAIAAPVAMLVALRGLLAPGLAERLAGRKSGAPAGGVLVRRRVRGPALAVLASAFVAAAALSSFLALRQAPVSPPDHADELAEIRPLVAGDPVLFLGRDDFIAWHLRGAPVSTQIQNFFSTDRVPARVDPENGEKFDFDAVSSETLDRFDWVVTTSSGYASDPPASFAAERRTPSYVLWRREGSTGPREILDEGAAPGAPLRCGPANGDAASGSGGGSHPGAAGSQAPTRGEAVVWNLSPLVRPASVWRPAATIGPGAPARQRLRLAPGRWEVSIAYDSPRELAVRTGIEPIGPAAAEGEATAARGAGIRTAGSLPANLDFRGPTPPFPVLRPRGAGALELDVRSPAAVTVEVELAEAPFAGRVLGASGEAHLRGLHLAPVDAVESVHGPRACGEYVDWYRPERLAE